MYEYARRCPIHFELLTSDMVCPTCRERETRKAAERADEANALLSEQTQLLRDQQADKERREQEQLDLLREQTELARRRLEAEGVCGRCGRRFEDRTRRRQRRGETWTGSLRDFAQEGVCPDCYYRLKEGGEVSAWSDDDWRAHLRERLAATRTATEAEQLGTECRGLGLLDVAAEAEELSADLEARQLLAGAKDSHAARLLAAELRRRGREHLAAEADRASTELAAREREAEELGARQRLAGVKDSGAARALADELAQQGLEALAAEAERRFRELHGREQLVGLCSPRKALLLRDELRAQGQDALASEAERRRAAIAARYGGLLDARLRSQIAAPASEQEALQTRDLLREDGFLELADATIARWAERAPAVLRHARAVTLLAALARGGVPVDERTALAGSARLLAAIEGERPVAPVLDAVRVREAAGVSSPPEQLDPAADAKLAEEILELLHEPLEAHRTGDGAFSRALALWRDVLILAGGAPSLRAAILDRLARDAREERSAVGRLLKYQLCRRLAEDGAPARREVGR